MTGDPELAAVESALSALALAQTDGALERAISRLLPGLLAALGTKSAPARTRIIQALQHINVRVRGVPSLKLPFAAVLEAASSPAAAIMTANVAIQGGYVARCFDRLTSAERAGALSPLVRAAHSLRARSRANVDAVLALAVRSIGQPRGRWAALEDTPAPAFDAFLEYCLRALRRSTKVAHSADELRAVVGLCSEYAGVKMPARAAKVFPHFLVAAGCVTDSQIADAGVDALKRVDATEQLLEHRPELVNLFFELFCEEGAHVALRTVVLSKGLLRAPAGAERFPEVITVLEKALYSQDIPMRLRTSGMQYLSYVIKHASQPVIRSNEEVLRAGILTVINNPGTVPYAARAFMYTALVQLIVRVPESIEGHDRFIPEILFTAAQDPNEPAEVRASAAHALVVLADTYAGSNSAHVEKILVILKKTIANQSDAASGARASAVQWANQCFPFSNAQARLLNIAASADQRTEVRDAALAGLSPKRYRNLSLARKIGVNDKESKENDVADMVSSYPNFVDVVWAMRHESADSTSGIVMYPEAWASFFHFALRNLKENARGDRSTWDVETLAKYVENNVQVKAALGTLRSYADQRVMTRQFDTSARMKRSALAVVLTVAQIELGVSSVARVYAPQIPALLDNCSQCSSSGDTIIVEAFAALVGVASTALSKDDAVSLLKKLGDGLEPLSAGKLDSRQGEHDRIAKILTLGHVITEQVRGGSSSAFHNDILNSSAKLLCRTQDSVEPSQSVRAAACRAIALVGVLGPMFSLDHTIMDNNDSGSSTATKNEESAIAQISKIIQASSSEAMLVEVACTAVAGICVGEPTTENLSSALKTIFDLAKNKKEDEVQFTAAESLVRVATGFNIPPPRILDDTTKSAEDDDLQELLRRRGVPLASHESRTVGNVGKVMLFEEEYALNVPGILDACANLCLNPRPHARACGGLFLFTFLKLIGSVHGSSLSAEYRFATPRDEELFKTIQEHVGNILAKAHRSFTTLLSDRSDLVQQLASRGISLVYELSPPNAQEDLVHSLIRSLTATKARSGSTVAGDEGGLVELPGLPAGSSGAAPATSKPGGATYKELCSLAQDMGQPDLVYKFMDLAGHAALWNSRRGAALAGSSLLDTDIAAKQLRPHAKTLLPRLYVYCYDPSEGIRLAMSSVLRAVAKAAGHNAVVSAVNEFYDDIVRHCLKSIVASQWRVREAGCGALRDALSSRRWEEVEEWLKEFWYICLRALDDISERVRKQAWGLGQALSELSISLCDPAQSGLENASKAAGIAVPALLSAFTHRVDEVRALASKTLSKILRFGGEALKESIPDIAYRMLESATEVEAPVLNYAQFHVEQKEALESARAQIASDSTQPWIESLERIVGLVDESVAKALVPKITTLARSGVGVPTRAATARFFSSLLRTRPDVMKKHAHRLMKASMTAARMDRNATLRRAWCAAVGMAAKLASVDAVGKTCDEMAELAGSDDAKDRALASFLAIGLWRQAPDVAKKHGSALLPVAYMGMFETDCGEDVIANWVDVWNEGCPSSDAGLRIYATEICDICVERLESSTQYKVKQCAAVSLGALADASNSSVNVDLLAKAATALLKALPGRMFDGKAAIIDALGSIADVDNASTVWERVGGPETVVNAALKECFRGKQSYRAAALAALAAVLKSARSTVIDFFPQIQEKLSPLWSASDAPSSIAATKAAAHETGDDAAAVDERNKARKALRAATVASLQCAEAAYIGSEAKEMEDQISHFKVLLSAIAEAMHHERDVRGPVLECLAAAVGRTERSALLDAAVMPTLLQCATQGVKDAKFAKVRRAGIALLEKMKAKIGDQAFKASIGAEIRSVIAQMASKDSDPSVQGEAEKLRAGLMR